MTMLPSLIAQSVLEELNRVKTPFQQLHDQNFGLGLLNDDLQFNLPSFLTPYRSGYIRSARPQRQEIGNSGISDVVNDGKNFKVNLSVPQFKPEEVIVKLVDNYLVIEGKHEERQDEHGIISRQFVRRYKLPKNVITDTISSTISSDGVLSITAKKAIAAGNERRIPVVPTYQLAVRSEDRQVANKDENGTNHE